MYKNGFTTTKINYKGGSCQGKGFFLSFPFAPAKYGVVLFHNNVQN